MKLHDPLNKLKVQTGHPEDPSCALWVILWIGNFSYYEIAWDLNLEDPRQVDRIALESHSLFSLN